MKRLIQALTAAGFVAEHITPCSMAYDDGEMHREIYDGVRVFVGYSDTNEARRLVKKCRAYTVTSEHIMPDGVYLHIMRTADAAKRSEADEIAKRFHAAFWAAIHAGLNQADAITAGKKAIA
jgi:hypothetical protein